MTSSTSNLPSLGAPRAEVLIAAWAGLLWPVLAVTRAPLTRVLDQPSWTADQSEIVSYYADSSFDATFVIGMAVATLAYVLFLVFVAKLAQILRDEWGSSWIGYLIVGGATMETAVVVAYLAPFGAAVFWADHGGVSQDVYLALHGLSIGFLWLDLIAITAWMAPLGATMIRSRLFPTWLGWIFVVNSAALLVSFFLPYEAWAVTGGFPYLWILITALVMLRTPDRYAPAPERMKTSKEGR